MLDTIKEIKAHSKDILAQQQNRDANASKLINAFHNYNNNTCVRTESQLKYRFAVWKKAINATN